MSISGQLLFAIAGLVAIVTAVLTVSQRSPLRAAVSLLVHVISLAGLYLTLHAHLLAAIQLLVYAGAVVVLFVFVIMLIGPGAMETARDQRGLMLKTLGGATVTLVAGAIAFQVGEALAPLGAVPGCAEGQADCQEFGGVDALSQAIYVGAAIPFELVSVLLLVAIVGAIAVARGHTDAEKKAKDPVELDPRPRSADPAAVDPSGQTPAE
ncbi:MAG: NADH-quinone oxidoreductase subunit J [Sandaracinaceae bacterium]